MFDIHAHINVICLKIIAGIVVLVLLMPTWYSFCVGAVLIYMLLIATNEIRRVEIAREETARQEHLLWREKQKFKRGRRAQ